MAGSFGFEADKYQASVAIGEQTLLPKVRGAAPDAVLVADGFSCREQVEQLTDRHALHTAEVLSLAMHDRLPRSGKPEAEVVEVRRRELRKSRRRAAVALGVGTASVLALSMLWMRRRN
jgi:hypothetical protein